jgi:hypothetical protein
VAGCLLCRKPTCTAAALGLTSCLCTIVLRLRARVQVVERSLHALVATILATYRWAVNNAPVGEKRALLCFVSFNLPDYETR